MHKDIQNHITPASFSCSRRAMRTALTDTANCARIRVTTPRSTPGQNPCNHLATSPDRRVDCGGHTDTTHTATSPFTFTYMFTFICPLGLRGLRDPGGGTKAGDARGTADERAAIMFHRPGGAQLKSLRTDHSSHVRLTSRARARSLDEVASVDEHFDWSGVCALLRPYTVP